MWYTTSHNYFLGKIYSIHEAYSYYISRQERVQSICTDQRRLTKYISMTGILPFLNNKDYFFSFKHLHTLFNWLYFYIQIISSKSLVFADIHIRYLAVLVVKYWSHILRVSELLLFLNQFRACYETSITDYPRRLGVPNPFSRGLKRHLFVSDFFNQLSNLGYKEPVFCVLTYKVSETNLYLTVMNSFGDVIISRSAGSLGIRKVWERQYPGTFAKLLDICLKFVQKYKLADYTIVNIPSYKSAYNKIIYWKAQVHGVPVWAIQFMPKQIHGHSLRARRYKRL